MKRLLVFLLLIASITAIGGRNNKKRYRGLPRTEEGLMHNVLGCLANKDSVSYFYLFPPFDTLWQLVLHNPDRSPEAIKALNHLKENPQSLIAFDPYYNRSIMTRFYEVLKKGEDSGIHWNSIAMQRYELHKEQATRSLLGYERIASDRFKGYLFVRDILGRYTFCITITEIQKINGFFFGGQLLNILEASTIDQFNEKEAQEKKYFDWLAKNPIIDTPLTDTSKKSATTDTAKAKKIKKTNLSMDDGDEEEKSSVRKKVIDRRYYEGKFDNEIPVKLYIRYLKDRANNKTYAYDGLYKFGDQVKYVKLYITRTPDGKWNMEDDPSVGTLELTLKDKTYTGSWTNNDNNTGYDAVLTQADLPQKKLEQLENILEKGLSGRVDEEANEDKIKPPVKIPHNEINKDENADKEKTDNKKTEPGKNSKDSEKASEKSDETDREKRRREKKRLRNLGEEQRHKKDKPNEKDKVNDDVKVKP